MIDAAKIEELREDNRRKRALLMDYLTANAVLDLAAASLAREGEDGELCKALTSYQQADEDGVMVLVSRQACDEAATRIRALASEKEGLRRETGRQCVNCGRWFPKEWDRAKAPDDCKSPDACTIDMTADEAWQHWRKEAHTERARAESSEALVAELREKVERLTKALLRLQNGAAVALDALPEDQREGVVGNFLAAIHRECCAGLCASKGADECKEATP